MLILGSLKKILFISQYESGRDFKMYITGGIIGNKDKIKIGNNVSLHGWLISDGGLICVGDNTVIHHGTVVRSMNKVTIGNYGDIGTDCYIQDHNSMSLDYSDRRKKGGKVISKPISIGDDVWIGRRVMILKGVKIGYRSVIGAGAVVTNDVPPNSVAVGNPAKVVKLLESRNANQ